MKQQVLFMGKEPCVDGDNLSDILRNAFPQMVEAAIEVYNELPFVNAASKDAITFRQAAETWFNYYHAPTLIRALAKTNHRMNSVRQTVISIYPPLQCNNHVMHPQ